MGCHFLLQCVKVKSESEVTQSCPTLRDPMECSLPGSSVHGIFQARVLEWGAIAFSEAASQRGAKARLPAQPCCERVSEEGAGSQSCLFVTPWTIARQAPLSMGFPRQKYWIGLPFPSLGDLPDPGIEPMFHACQVDSLPLSHPACLQS